MSNYRKKIKKLEKELDSLWSEYIRRRDFWTCMKCHVNFMHEPNKLHAAHIIPKGRSKFLRWNVDNGIALCYSHHIFWQHKGGNEIEFSRLCEKVRGKKKIDQLLKLKQDIVKFNLKDLESKKSELTSFLDELDR